ncbi:hypothetical protein ACFO5K_04210 [Nocardia halotolerans]|uniref:Transcriptional regulator n=1 Tax=Nocardia halotolerans TaxID=1755878 RepID=A0ABV8VCI2_9NOCA
MVVGEVYTYCSPALYDAAGEAFPEHTGFVEEFGELPVGLLWFASHVRSVARRERGGYETGLVHTPCAHMRPVHTPTAGLVVRGVLGATSKFEGCPTYRLSAEWGIDMTTLESRVMEALSQRGRLLYPGTLAAILHRPRHEIEEAVESLRAKRLVMRNACGQWSAYRVRRVS